VGHFKQEKKEKGRRTWEMRKQEKKKKRVSNVFEGGKKVGSGRTFWVVIPSWREGIKGGSKKAKKVTKFQRDQPSFSQVIKP